MDARGVGGFHGISIALIGRVAKEGRISHWGGGLPIPLTEIPGKAFDESGFENPKEGC